jgi:hypothetical protein
MKVERVRPTVGVRTEFRKSMRSFCLILAMFAVSCASLHTQKPETVVQHHPETTPPSVCETVVSAINRGDWDALKVWAKPGTTANESLTTWQKAADAGHPVKVGKFLNSQTVGGTSKRPYKLYSFSLENKDGTVNPHWLQIKVREEEGQAEIVDFWNFGW